MTHNEKYFVFVVLRFAPDFPLCLCTHHADAEIIGMIADAFKYS